MLGYLCDNIGLVQECLPSGSEVYMSQHHLACMTQPSGIPILSPVHVGNPHKYSLSCIARAQCSGSVYTLCACAKSMEHGGVRKRKGNIDHRVRDECISNESDCNTGSVDEDGKPAPSEKEIASGSYWLARITFIRALGFVYCKYILWYSEK